MKTHKALLFILSLLLSYYAYGQPIFGQELFNKMLVNPAYTAEDSSKDKLLQSFEKYDADYPVLLNFLVSYQMQIDIKSSIGIIANYNEYQEDTRMVYPYGTEGFCAFWQSALKGYYRYSPLKGLAIGADIGIINFKTFYTSDPGGIPYTSPKNVYPDIGVGISYTYKNLYAGFSMDNLTEPQHKFYFYTPGYYQPYIDVPNFHGIEYNFSLGGNIKINDYANVDLIGWYSGAPHHFSGIWSSTFFFSGLLHMKQFFIGITAVSGIYPLDYTGIPYGGISPFSPIYNFYGGVQLFNNHLRLSFAYDVYPGYLSGFGGFAPKQNATQNIEGMQGFQF